MQSFNTRHIVLQSGGMWDDSVFGSDGTRKVKTRGTGNINDASDSTGCKVDFTGVRGFTCVLANGTNTKTVDLEYRYAPTGDFIKYVTLTDATATPAAKTTHTTTDAKFWLAASATALPVWEIRFRCSDAADIDGTGDIWLHVIR